MTEIKVVVVNGREKAIQVSDGRVLILCGDGPNDGAFWKKFEECSEADFEAAKEVENTHDVETEDATADEYRVGFEDAVNMLAYMRGEKFLELVRYARCHGNSFSGYEKLENVVNADDCYCTAIIKLTRNLGDAVERRAFKLFEDAVERQKAEEFLDFWNSVQTINSLL